jgi:hypothetical protein
MKHLAQLIFCIAVMTAVVAIGVETAAAQISSQEPVTVAGDANACELNALHLDMLINVAREGSERVFVVARLGRGETSRYLVHRRLHNARTYLVGRLAPESVILAEGERTNEQGRVEFYLGSRLMIKALVARGGDLCVDCCEGLEHYYGWGKKDSRRRRRQLQYLTPQPDNGMHPTANSAAFSESLPLRLAAAGDAGRYGLCG